MKKIKLLTNEQNRSYENAKVCYISKKKLKKNTLKLSNNANLGTIAFMQV